ncbi:MULTISPECIES: class I SAM-dependent methyltransferase [Bacillus cereus group]|uniref:class I SAM-dependent methyltransferase n=1 Tax=Bacillus cereus group TaxID=86661 RepID=UPI00028AE412|nr:class I SAM-dependent methyltransferase [Bacillus toyonensis]AFU13678.1 Methyltransferase type 11 [Bacillus thuringiensis MC28]OTW88049.1 SAM-dependent methyltransferase [Bacillus thuringiensis serovar cameroun]OTX11693.1 SAM-dependent methyltransferase [Bacillus thuringiensis serovar seoulensis]QPW48001.1 class I SAM-dependent methyltransferase [Bacillus thuringiensis]MCA1045624.1 class I SAM-dependent methyltransferase [Bacillus toyonensis]
MKRDPLFLTLLDSANTNFSGWDFSFISETSRMKSEPLSWSYGSTAFQLIQHAKSMLDMGTGGGELLSMLQPFPPTIYATEGYAQNVPIARKKLEPLGVIVVEVKDDDALPLQDAQFDLIVNQHESYAASEVNRILSPNGIFLTQQAGGLDCAELNKQFGTPLNSEFASWSLETACNELKENGFTILDAKEEFPLQRFYDIGAIVYYLKAIPWQIPDFTVERYYEELYCIHEIMLQKGYFDVKQHRFIIKAIRN